MSYQELRETKTATIAASGNLSGAVILDGLTVVGLVMPSAWTAADLTFQASADGTTYANVYNSSGSELTFTVAASRFIMADPIDLVGMRWIKVRSGTSGTPVAQAAERAITLVVRPV